MDPSALCSAKRTTDRLKLGSERKGSETRRMPFEGCFWGVVIVYKINDLVGNSQVW